MAERLSHGANAEDRGRAATGVGERALLAHIQARSTDLGARFSHVVVGPGDDCAVIETKGGKCLLTVDQIVEGRHFTRALGVELIARKAVGRSISDLAAMAGRPLWGLATAAIPADFAEADALFDAMARWGRSWGAPLVGGDITSTDGPLLLTVTVGGVADHARGPVLRSTARVGDGVYVTGRLGGSLESGKHAAFIPRVDAAWALAEALGEELTAMMDLSDGLGVDGARLAAASGVRLELEAEALPVSACLDGAAWARALADGEDYELLFTSSREIVTAAGVEVTRVGRVASGSGCVIRAGGEWVDASGFGWEH
ncbi:MAG: thiamine-monophosphate kinase [Phycisphaeraceae bacterium]|nr:thiamine-monophosphate kinase [Phycisphaeraceae bacterium]